MKIFSTILNALLVSFTGYYVYLTYKLLKLTSKSSDRNQKLITDQLRLNSIPSLNYYTTYKDLKTYLIIENIGNNPAYDLDIWVIFSFDNEDEPKIKFIENNVKDEYKKNIDYKSLLDDTFWSIAERGIYPILPAQAYIEIPLKSPLEITIFDLLIQFRDGLKNNYSQRIIFDANSQTEIPFAPTDFEPIVLEIEPRAEFASEETQEDDLLDFQKWLFQLIRISIPMQFIKGEDSYSYSEYRWIIRETQ